MLFYLLLLDVEEDRDQFSMIYENYNRLMFYIAKKILGEGPLAEDAVHEALIVLIERFEKVRGANDLKVKNLVTILAKNKAIDILRKRRAGEVIEPEIFEDIGGDDPNLDKSLAEIIKALPETLRDVIELNSFYGFSYTEIAEMLGIKETAVRKRIERGRAKIAEEYHRAEDVK